ncbi:MAG: glycerol-3-phosphate dehydrogenase/oxidase [Phormidesmis sp.]
MQRNLPALANQSFDLLVIGGGIHGACVAWEASLRGLSIALVERSDFASGTSANSLKVIHGGLRYLQTADFRRMRQSIRARQTMMRIAPHLVHPMPVLVPTYGHSIKGKEAMAIALKLNDLISCDRNLSLSDPQKHIPAGEMLSRDACLEQLPDLAAEGLTGAARFYDAQMYNSEQLVLAFLRSAASRGAQIANYVSAIDFCKEGDRVVAANVEDQLTGDRFTIQAKTVVNASGPWIDALIAQATGNAKPPQPLAKAMNLVTRSLFGPQQKCAVGITGRAPGSRLFFIAPWRDHSLVGTWYGPDTEQTKPPSATSTEIKSFLADINKAYPTFNLTPDDVQWVHSGLLPSYGISEKTGEVQLTKQFQLTDHRSDGFEGLLSMTGVKYTTAYDLARRAVDWAVRAGGTSHKPLPLSHKAPLSNQERLQGGRIERFDRFMETAMTTYREQIPAKALRQLVYNYGSDYESVLQCVQPSLKGTSVPVSNQDVLAAEVRYSLAHTMPQTLSDVIFRRTELGAVGHPGSEALQLCSDVMAEALDWSLEKKQAEVQQVQQCFDQRCPAQSSVRPPCPV